MQMVTWDYFQNVKVTIIQCKSNTVLLQLFMIGFATWLSFLNQKLPYLYKFSRDVYFTDATNSAFLRFYFRGSQDFVLVDYAHY